MSVTFDLELWPWPYVKVKKTYVIKCRLLYCTLVPGMMSVSVIVCEIWPIVHIYMAFDLRLWPSSSVKVTFIFIIRWMLYCCVLVPSTKFVGSIVFEIWTIVWRKLKWRHNDVISHSNVLKYKHTSTKSISKWHSDYFDQT